MGLFGLSNAEALVLVEEMRSAQAKRDRELQRELHNEQMKLQSKQSAQEKELAQRQIAQIATEARKTEPCLTLTLSLSQGKSKGEKVCVRASDIKEIKGVDNMIEESHYDESCFQCCRKSFEHYKETHITLWDFSLLKVRESVEDIQSKINESINEVNEAQARILKDMFMN